MTLKSISASSYSPSFDLGHPFLNHTLDGFLRIGTVGLAKGAIEEAWHMTRHGRVSKNSIEHSVRHPLLAYLKFSTSLLYVCDGFLQVKRMCMEGALWGTVAGVYVGMEYGAGKIRGTSDWKNAMIGGALAGAVVSAVTKNSRDVIISHTITGGALATASVLLNYLTY
ncbi:hypothetical protein V2J09_010881 [Rumex salicifolius]